MKKSTRTFITHTQSDTWKTSKSLLYTTWRMETRGLAAKPLSCSRYFSAGADKGDTLPRIKAFVIHSRLWTPPSTPKINIPPALMRPRSILTRNLGAIRIHGWCICLSLCISLKVYTQAEKLETHVSGNSTGLLLILLCSTRMYSSIKGHWGDRKEESFYA